MPRNLRSARAIAGIRPADLEGATFTVSNLGAYGVENGTPVIFAPQVALMFVGAIRDEVLAIDGRPEVRPAMQIAIAYDHRGIDGATASRFTTRIKAILEAPIFSGAKRLRIQRAGAREVVVEAIGDLRYSRHLRFDGWNCPPKTPPVPIQSPPFSARSAHAC